MNLEQHTIPGLTVARGDDTDPRWQPAGPGMYVVGMYLPCCGGPLADFLAEADQAISVGAQRHPGRRLAADRGHRFVDTSQIPQPERDYLARAIRQLVRARHRGPQVVQVWRLWQEPEA